MEQILLERIRNLCSPFLSGRGVELVDLLIRRERGRSILRFLVDRPEGITIDECARLNEEISQILDKEDIIQQSYILEVASPGLDRPLISTRDFQRNLGRLVKIVLHKPLRGKNVWTGFLDGVDDENIIIRTQEQESLTIARENIARANLEVRL